MASNVSAIADQDGEYDDWIEIYNNTNQQINMLGCYLSDNTDSLKWAFPDTSISPIALPPILPVIYDPFVEYSFANKGEHTKEIPATVAASNCLKIFIKIDSHYKFKANNTITS